MEVDPREAPVDVRAVGHEANINAHEEDDPSMLDFSGTVPAQEATEDKRDLAELKQASGKVAELLYVS